MNQPWMPLYIGDYLSKTRALNTVGHGTYLLLIMEYWTHGKLPDDDAALAQIALLSDREWLKIKPTIARFFQMPGWKHKRIDEELEKTQALREKRSRAGQLGGKAKASGVIPFKQKPSGA